MAHSYSSSLRRHCWKAGLAFVLALTLCAGNAAADSITYDLDTPNTNLPGATGLFGKVKIDLTSFTTAIVTFTSNTSPTAVSQNGNRYAVIFIDSNIADLNIKGTFSVSTPFTESSSFLNLGHAFKNVTSGNVDGFGSFNLVGNNKAAFTDGATSISFTLTSTSGGWASAGAVTTANNKGHLLAAHVDLVTIDAKGNAVDSAITGYATNSGGPQHPPVPEPTSFILLGGLLGGLGAFGYGRKRIWSAA